MNEQMITTMPEIDNLERTKLVEGLADRLNLNSEEHRYLTKIDAIYRVMDGPAFPDSGYRAREISQEAQERLNQVQTLISPERQEEIRRDYDQCFRHAASKTNIEEARDTFANGIAYEQESVLLSRLLSGELEDYPK